MSALCAAVRVTAIPAAEAVNVIIARATVNVSFAGVRVKPPPVMIAVYVMVQESTLHAMEQADARIVRTRVMDPVNNARVWVR